VNILGLSCYYHDSATCLLKDGEIIAAAQEERFNREKYSSVFPLNAANFCLQAGDLTIYDIDYICFYEKPFLKFSRVILRHLRSYPFSLKNFLDTTPSWLADRLILPIVLKRELGYERKTFFIKHHLSHADSAFLVSPYEEAAILTADGVGEWATTTLGFGRGNNIKIFKEIIYPDSLGLLYAIITTCLGFKVFEGEGKVMGLSAYGKPKYLNKFREIITVKSDGSFKLDMAFFAFNKGLKMYSKRLVEAFGKERNSEDKIEERHCDIAASLQVFIEETLITIARNLYNETRVNNLCLAGGVFLNCVANGRILEETPFKEIFIQPAAGDSGGALGAASYLYHSVLGNKRNYIMKDAYFGPDFSLNQIERILINLGIKFKRLSDPELTKYIAKKLSEDKTIGWVQGKMEWGPRALGNRSILANPCNPDMKDILNAKIKKRESFRPYAPAVLEERAGEFFQLKTSSPFMLLASRVIEGKKATIPAVTHVDGTARVQTVSKQTNPRFWQLIKEFENITGVPVVLNTSFNLRGEPIVCTPEEAIDCLQRSQMDYLVLENYIIEKNLSKEAT